MSRFINIAFLAAAGVLNAVSQTNSPDAAEQLVPAGADIQNNYIPPQNNQPQQGMNYAQPPQPINVNGWSVFPPAGPDVCDASQAGNNVHITQDGKNYKALMTLPDGRTIQLKINNKDGKVEIPDKEQKSAVGKDNATMLQNIKNLVRSALSACLTTGIPSGPQGNQNSREDGGGYTATPYPYSNGYLYPAGYYSGYYGGGPWISFGWWGRGGNTTVNNKTIIIKPPAGSHGGQTSSAGTTGSTKAARRPSGVSRSSGAAASAAHPSGHR